MPKRDQPPQGPPTTGKPGTRSEQQHVAPGVLQPPGQRGQQAVRRKRRRRLQPDRDAHGNPVCVLCGQPTHPEHPNSPHCQQHYREARTEAQRKSRKAAADFEALADRVADAGDRTDVHISSRGVILLASAVAELREARGDLLAAYAEAQSLTSDFAPGNTADFYLARLVVLKKAVEDFNEVLAPILRRPQENRD